MHQVLCQEGGKLNGNMLPLVRRSLTRSSLAFFDHEVYYFLQYTTRLPLSSMQAMRERVIADLEAPGDRLQLFNFCQLGISLLVSSNALQDYSCVAGFQRRFEEARAAQKELPPEDWYLLQHYSFWLCLCYGKSFQGQKQRATAAAARKLAKVTIFDISESFNGF